VEFAPLADPDFVPYAVAEVLGIRERAGHSLTATLAGDLRGRRLLLDTCEHPVGSEAAEAEALLRAGAGLHIFETGRETKSAEPADLTTAYAARVARDTRESGGRIGSGPPDVVPHARSSNRRWSDAGA
jgi:predicted ATPase